MKWWESEFESISAPKKTTTTKKTNLNKKVILIQRLQKENMLYAKNNTSPLKAHLAQSTFF